MSLLDVDEWLLEMAKVADIVYGPVVDTKEYPENVDVALVEGAVANDDNLEMIKKVRERTKLIIAFGDCAVTGNVTAMRNPLGSAEKIIKAVYVDRVDADPQMPKREHTLPVLLERVRPLHEVVAVDFYLHGCPPSADRIRAAIEAVLTQTFTGAELSPNKFG
jgi:NAD-reducing hydrogenase small subunit